jgi:hypothetical protein
LFAVADAIGEDWPERIRDAAAFLAPRESESTGTLLLADIGAVFDEKQTDRMASADLAEALAALEARPWAEWRASKGASPKPLTKYQLAQLLKPFKIVSDSVRIGDRTPKGYYRHQFDEAFQRYLAAEGVYDSQQRNKPTAAGTSATFQNATEETVLRPENSEKPNDDGPCCGVASQNGGGGHEGGDDAWPKVCDHCGDPERPGKPVREYWFGGEHAWLHQACEDGWRGDDLTIPVFLRR